MQIEAAITGKESIAPAWWLLSLTAPELAPRLLPGQFLLVRCADRFACYLRRAVYPVPAGDDLIFLLRPESDAGLAWLASRVVGDRLDVIGPLGAGFPLARHVHNLLLVSDGQAIGPLLGQMERAIAAGIAVTLVLGGSRASALYPAATLPPVVEYHVATLDGSMGHRGQVTELLPELLPWADVVCAAGSIRLYRTLQSQVETVRFGREPGFLYGLVGPTLLACGLGACMGCTLETERGRWLACTDGPVFDLALLEV